MNYYLFRILYIILALINLNKVSSQCGDRVKERVKRQLMYPNTTLLQLNIGLGTPTPVKTVNMNWAFQANFQLPWNRTQIPTDIFLANSDYIGRTVVTKAKRNTEMDGTVNTEKDKNKENLGINNDINEKDLIKYFKEKVISKEKLVYEEAYRDEVSKILTDYGVNVNARVIDNKGNDNDNFIKSIIYDTGGYEEDAKLYHLYKYVEEILDSFGHNGTSCVLQTLCILGKEPLHTHDPDDVVFEIAEFVLNPNQDLIGNQEIEEMKYLEAYNNGKDGKDCFGTYNLCTFSLIDKFTYINDY